MTSPRFYGSLALAGMAVLLSGCVVAPLGPPAVAYRGPYVSPAVYAQPAPVVVVPQYRYYGYPGYPGYRSYRGHHHHHWR